MQFNLKTYPSTATKIAWILGLFSLIITGTSIYITIAYFKTYPDFPLNPIFLQVEFLLYLPIAVILFFKTGRGKLLLIDLDQAALTIYSLSRGRQKIHRIIASPRIKMISLSGEYKNSGLARLDIHLFNETRHSFLIDTSQTDAFFQELRQLDYPIVYGQTNTTRSEPGPEEEKNITLEQVLAAIQFTNELTVRKYKEILLVFLLSLLIPMMVYPKIVPVLNNTLVFYGVIVIAGAWFVWALGMSAKNLISNRDHAIYKLLNEHPEAVQELTLKKTKRFYQKRWILFIPLAWDERLRIYKIVFKISDDKFYRLFVLGVRCEKLFAQLKKMCPNANTIVENS